MASPPAMFVEKTDENWPLGFPTGCVVVKLRSCQQFRLSILSERGRGDSIHAQPGRVDREKLRCVDEVHTLETGKSHVCK